MTLMRATIRYPYTTGLARDVSENVLHFEGTGSASTIRSYWSTILQSIHTSVVNTGLPFPSLAVTYSSFLSPIVNRAGCQISWAEVDPATGDVDPELLPRQALTISAATSAQSLPLEVAFCLSFKSQAVIDSGGIPARAKGRIYFGPFHNTSMNTGTGALPRPSETLRQASVNTIARLIGGGFTAGGAGSAAQGDLVIYSRTSHVAQIVDSGWVDDQWDTQRRRGQDPTTKTVYP